LDSGKNIYGQELRINVPIIIIIIIIIIITIITIPYSMEQIPS